MKPVTYPVFTVVVFAGASSSRHLKESYRRTFETKEDALRYARTTVMNPRLSPSEGRVYYLPSACVFEDSPSRGVGSLVGEANSRARTKFLNALASAGGAK